METTYKMLSDGNILVHIPMQLVKQPTCEKLITDEPGKNKERMAEISNIQNVALGLKYRRLAQTDEFSSRSKMAQHFGVDTSYLTRVIRLGYLAPEIIERLTRGQLTHIKTQDLLTLQTPIWSDQMELLGIK